MLVAVSGGADSTALLVGLAHLRRERGVTLTAAHLHHGLRGAEADADLAHVRALCDALAVPLIAARWDCRRRMEALGTTGQNGLRALRRRFLVRATRRAGAGWVATAHTADDQLETLLMRLGRGAGLTGMAGIRPRRGRWWRPLLEVTRADVEADLRRAGIEWREDASNRDPRWLRSRLRHQVVPALARALWPAREAGEGRTRLARQAARWAATVASADVAVSRLAGTRRSGLVRIERGTLRLASVAADSYPASVQRRLLTHAWRRLLPGGPGLTARHLEALCALLGPGPPGAAVALPAGRCAVREREALWIGPRERSAEPLVIPGAARCGQIRVTGRWVAGAAARRALRSARGRTEYFAASGLAGALELRAPRVDETFVPFAGSQAVSVLHWVARQPVRRALRVHPTVLADAGGVLWVVGVRRSARAEVGPATRRVLEAHAEIP